MSEPNARINLQYFAMSNIVKKMDTLDVMYAVTSSVIYLALTRFIDKTLQTAAASQTDPAPEESSFCLNNYETTCLESSHFYSKVS